MERLSRLKNQGTDHEEGFTAAVILILSILSSTNCSLNFLPGPVNYTSLFCDSALYLSIHMLAVSEFEYACAITITFVAIDLLIFCRHK